MLRVYSRAIVVQFQLEQEGYPRFKYYSRALVFAQVSVSQENQPL